MALESFIYALGSWAQPKNRVVRSYGTGWFCFFGGFFYHLEQDQLPGSARRPELKVELAVNKAQAQTCPSLKYPKLFSQARYGSN